MGGGREVQGRETYVYLWLIHVDVWQKPTQYCKAIILELKINNFFKGPLDLALCPLSIPTNQHGLSYVQLNEIIIFFNSFISSPTLVN